MSTTDKKTEQASASADGEKKALSASAKEFTFKPTSKEFVPSFLMKEPAAPIDNGNNVSESIVDIVTDTYIIAYHSNFFQNLFLISFHQIHLCAGLQHWRRRIYPRRWWICAASVSPTAHTRP